MIGAFREEFFIDSVDYDYCLRARSRGFRVIKLCRVGMIHSLGEAEQNDIGPLKVYTTNHNPMRRYYMFRNSTVLAREYFLKRSALFDSGVSFSDKDMVHYTFIGER